MVHRIDVATGVALHYSSPSPDRVIVTQTGQIPSPFVGVPALWLEGGPWTATIDGIIQASGDAGLQINDAVKAKVSIGFTGAITGAVEAIKY